MKRNVLVLLFCCFPLFVSTFFAQKATLKEINKKEFKQLVWDMTKNKKFVFQGDKPVVIDFYADWCAPCKKVHPILEELQYEYGDKLIIYRINIDKEASRKPDYPNLFKFESIPTLLFIKPGQKIRPKPIKIGGITKDDLKRMIDVYLFE